MARYAERHQIALLMCAAVSKRSDMMDERRKDISALLFAHLTERMPRQMTISNPAPRAVVSLMLIVAAREPVIMSLHRFLVLLAVAALPVR